MYLCSHPSQIKKALYFIGLSLFFVCLQGYSLLPNIRIFPVSTGTAYAHGGGDGGGGGEGGGGDDGGGDGAGDACDGVGGSGEGVAFRNQSGSWQMWIFVVSEPQRNMARRGNNTYVPAAGKDNSFNQMIDHIMAAPPLTPQQEKKIINAGWKKQ